MTTILQPRASYLTFHACLFQMCMIIKLLQHLSFPQPHQPITLFHCPLRRSLGPAVCFWLKSKSSQPKHLLSCFPQSQYLSWDSRQHRRKKEEQTPNALCFLFCFENRHWISMLGIFLPLLCLNHLSVTSLLGLNVLSRSLLCLVRKVANSVSDNSLFMFVDVLDPL